MVVGGIKPLHVFVLAFLVYVPGFWWGAPHATAPDRTHAWGVDDSTPLGSMAKVHNALTGTPDLHPGYPLLHPLMVVTAFAPYLGYLKLTGGLGAVSETYPYGMTDPVRDLAVLSWIAHLLSVLLAAGTVTAVFLAARMLRGVATATVAAVVALVAFPMFYYARNGNPDIAALFFTACALAVYARILVDRLDIRLALWLGVFTGLAVATKEPAVASFVGVPFAVVGIELTRRPSAWRTWRFWQPALVALAAAFIAYGVGSGMFVAPRWWLQHITFASERAGELAGGSVAFFESFPRTLDGHIALTLRISRYLANALTLPGLILAAAGLAWAAAEKKAALLLFALPAITYLLILFWSSRVAQLRYMLPLVLTLSFFAAYAITNAWQSRRLAVRVTAGAVTVAAVALNLLRGVDLTYAMLKDSRWDAGAWLAVNAHGGDEVQFFDASQKLPPLAAGIVTERAATYLGAIVKARLDTGTVELIRERWRTEKPRFVVVMPDHSSPPGAPYSASCPPEIYDALMNGSLGYRLAARFQQPALLPWVRRPALDYPAVNPPILIFVPNQEVVS